MTTIKALLLLAIALPASAQGTRTRPAPLPYVPGATWERRSPATAGMDSAKLADAIAFAVKSDARGSRDMEENHYRSFGREPFGQGIGPFKPRGEPSGVILRGGYVIASWGEPDRVDMTHSVTKSLLSATVGVAFDRGMIASVRDTVWKSQAPTYGLRTSAPSEPGATYGHPMFIDPWGTPHNRTITWDDLLRQTSDWEGTLWGKPEWADRPAQDATTWTTRARKAPGTAYEYNDVRVNALALAATNLWRRPLPEVLQEHVMGPIGASRSWRWYGYDNSWITLDGRAVQVVSGGGHWGGGLFINAWDMARFGLLTERRGLWGDKRVLSEEWVKLSLTPTVPQPTYGYMNWFLNTDRKWMPSAPASAFGHVGNGTNLVFVAPEQDLVIVVRWIENNAIDEFLAKALGALVSGAPAGLGAQSPEWSTLIRGGTVVDGTGAARFAADIALRGDKIVAVSRTPLDASRAARVIDARGLIVAPGFIDMHAHLDPLLRMPDAKSAVTQGVTLALGGPDGGGPFPLKPYLDSAQRSGLGMNVAYLVGHNVIRQRVMGTENRAPTPDELQRMIALVRQGMGEGAFGMSTGLRYVPGYYSKTDEVVALARAAADSGGIYTSHLREEGLGLIEGVAEAITIARDGRIPVVLTHHKAVGQPMWGKSVETLRMVDAARAAGLDVMIDQYPYVASQTGLGVLIPPWALSGGTRALRERLADPVLRDSIEKGIVHLLETDRGGGDTKRVQFGSVAWDRTLEGKTLYDWAERRGVGHTMLAAAKLVLEGELNGSASMVYFIMDEGDVRRIMAHPQTMIASDGSLTRPGQGVPHPRSYGTFPRVLGEYVRVQKVLTLEQAVRKMTGMPAARLGLQGQRGCVTVGCFADITIFDAATVGSPATFVQPHQYATGIPFVIVNGVVVVSHGEMTAARPGRALQRR